MHHVVTFLFATWMQQSSTILCLFFLFFNVAWVKAGDDYLVAGTDGVGTKLKLAFETGIHDTIGIDLVCDHMLFAVLFMMCID
jgi:phosphoribosylaminoimidazole (AIR) synthetase